MNIRVIPRLDIKGPNLVKGVHFEGLRVMGKPEDFARHYCQTGADELIYMDAVASLYGRNSLLDIVEKTSKEMFVPLAVGGGLRSIDDIRKVLRAGADKVSINTAAIDRPDFIREASRAFGSSTIVVSIEAIKQPDGSYECFTDFGRESTGIDAAEWARRAVELGAGELIVTSIDREGTGDGFDTELIKEIATSVPVPVIAAGGAGRIEHVADAVTEGCADAVCVASILHYRYARQHRYDPSSFDTEGNIEGLSRGAPNLKIKDATIQEIKASLVTHGVECRFEEGE